MLHYDPTAFGRWGFCGAMKRSQRQPNTYHLSTTDNSLDVLIARMQPGRARMPLSDCILAMETCATSASNEETKEFFTALADYFHFYIP